MLASLDTLNREEGGDADMKRPPSRVWCSRGRSWERGVVSVLAVAEVAAGLALYWWLIPMVTGIDLHILISVCIAPLLLLRSPASVQDVLNAFARWYTWADKEIPLRSLRGVGLVLLAAIVAGGVSWLLADGWLLGHEGWSLYWRAAVVGWTALQIGLAAAIAGAVAGIGIWLGAMFAKITATLRHFKDGLAQLPWNWRVLVWALDLRHPPEWIL